MAPGSIAFITVFFLLLLITVKPFGLYMANVMEGKPIWPLRVGARFESFIYRLCGIDPTEQMGWKKYAITLLFFNVLGALAVYALPAPAGVVATQPPSRWQNVSPDSSFNTAVSFITNTNWQGYSGESTMSYLTQMAGLASAELPVGGLGHRRRHHTHSWVCAPQREHDRQRMG